MVLRPLKKTEDYDDDEEDEDSGYEDAVRDEEEQIKKTVDSKKDMKPLRESIDKPIKIVQVPSTYEPAYQFPDGSILNGQDILLWMANEIYKISKRLND